MLNTIFIKLKYYVQLLEKILSIIIFDENVNINLISLYIINIISENDFKFLCENTILL